MKQEHRELPRSFCINVGDFAILKGLDELLYEHQGAKRRYVPICSWYLNTQKTTAVRFCAVQTSADVFFSLSGAFFHLYFFKKIKIIVRVLIASLMCLKLAL